MTTTSLTLRNVSGSFAAAMARFVSGPTATMVIVPGSFSLNKSSMTSCAGLSDGVKSECFSLTFCSAAASSGARFFGWGVKSDFHVSSGERWGCCYASARILRGVGMVGKSLRYDVYLRVHRHRLRWYVSLCVANQSPEGACRSYGRSLRPSYVPPTALQHQQQLSHTLVTSPFHQRAITIAQTYQ